MQKALIIPVILIIAVSMGLAVPAQADLIGLTLLLATIWTSGVVVNETIINKDDQQDQQTARDDVEHRPDLALQPRSD